MTVAQRLTFELIVGDEGDLTAVDSIDVEVAPKAVVTPPPSPGGGGSGDSGGGGDGGGGGAFGAGTLIAYFGLVALGAWRRRR